ncbi:MAG: FtsX-like permease family protein [Actinomycetota bacterium]|nr:FtsX-like permease family protein [Actinomycetota bacterium]
MKKLILKNWRDIKARKAQFGALIILVALGISSYVSFVSAYLNLSASTEYAYEKLKFAHFSTKVISAPKRVVDKIQAIPGVEAVEGRLIIDTGLYISDGEQVKARVISIPPDQHPEVNDLLIEGGSYLKGKAKDVCLLEKHYADEREIELGDTLKPLVDGEKKEVIVEGIVVNPEYFNAVIRKAEIPSPGELAIIFMTQSEVERMFQKSPSYNDISVLLDKGANREEVIEKVEDILDPYLVIETVKREDQPSNFSIQEEIKQNQSMAYTMPFVILFVASISLFIALSRVVQSQRGEIGLAKALGYRNWQVLLHYLLFSLFIAFWGSVIGFALGTYFAKEIVELYTDIMGIPFLKHQLHLELIIGATSMSAIACILAGILPAYASARMRPATAMRADPNIALAKGRVPLIERAVTKILPISLTFRIPIRNVFRARRRSFYTVVGIAFALLLTTSTWAMLDSTNYLLDSMFYEVENWDMVAGFSQNFSHR